ncbi:MAG: VOC family protein [Chloroflexota bacterium]
MAVTLDMIGIAVRNMSDSLRFYRMLGLDIPEGQETEPHVEVAREGIRIAWDTVDLLEQVYGGWVADPIGHRIEIAFKCDSPAEVDATYAHVTEYGYVGHREPWDAFWGQRYAILQDPDGNLISLFA